MTTTELCSTDLVPTIADELSVDRKVLLVVAQRRYGDIDRMISAGLYSRLNWPATTYTGGGHMTVRTQGGSLTVLADYHARTMIRGLAVHTTIIDTAADLDSAASLDITIARSGERPRALTVAFDDTIEPSPTTLPVQLCPAEHAHPVAPTRAHDHDAGLDLYAAVSRWLEVGEITTIQLGVAVAIPEGHVGLIALRSSLGANGVALTNGAGIIDAGYRGELKAALTVWGDNPTQIKAGERIAQLIVVPTVRPDVVLVDQLPESSDGRGTGGFGSSGK